MKISNQNDVVHTNAGDAYTMTASLIETNVTVPSDLLRLIDPIEYLANHLLFEQALPSETSANYAPELNLAIEWHKANQTPVADYEYMLAALDMMKSGQIINGISITAVDQMTPDVQAFIMGQMDDPVSPYYNLLGGTWW